MNENGKPAAMDILSRLEDAFAARRVLKNF
jgi:hypothetical protein